MSIFGSREDDPLLRGDPFAPTSDDPSDEAADETASDGDEATDTVTDRSTRSDDTARHESGGPARGAREGPDESVFGPSSEQRTGETPPDSPANDGRVIVRPAEEAAAGRLSALNAALADGWRLRRVELRGDAPAGQSRPPTKDELSLAFVLHAPPS